MRVTRKATPVRPTIVLRSTPIFVKATSQELLAAKPGGRRR
jgi:hypothetical protein